MLLSLKILTKHDSVAFFKGYVKTGNIGSIDVDRGG